MRDIRSSIYKAMQPSEIDIWVVAFIDDECVDEFGAHVFLSKKEADEWVEWFLSDSEAERSVNVVHHKIIGAKEAGGGSSSSP